MSEMNYDGGLTCAVNVSDLDRALAWYQEVLGFKLLYRLDDLAWCELASPVERVNVGLSQTEKGGGPGGATLTWGVKNIDEARKRLEAKSVRFDGETHVIEGMVTLATFYDLDGNAMMLYEDLEKK